MRELWLHEQSCWSTPLFENETFRLLMGWTVGLHERTKAYVTRPDRWDRGAGLLIVRVEERHGIYGLGWLPLIIPIRYGSEGVSVTNSKNWGSMHASGSSTSLTLGGTTIICDTKLTAEIGHGIGTFIVNIEIGDRMEGCERLG